MILLVKLVSFEVYSDFGFFKKPDTNNKSTSMTYNLPPKPGILGMFGAILGLGGMNKQYETKSMTQDKDAKQKILPEYYRLNKDFTIGIKPMGKFPFNKIMNTYNSRNSYFGNEKYENIPIHEQILISPKYRIYVYDQNSGSLIGELANRLKSNNPVFMPYMGKNEFIASFDNVRTFDNVTQTNDAKNISSVFLTTRDNSDQSAIPSQKRTLRGDSRTVVGLPTGFKFVERYPIGHSKDMHYIFQTVQLEAVVDKALIDLKSGKLFRVDDEVIYLF